MKVTTYNLKASNGNHIRKATVVVFSDGRVVRFLDKLPAKQAIEQAQAVRACGGSSPLCWRSGDV